MKQPNTFSLFFCFALFSDSFGWKRPRVETDKGWIEGYIMRSRNGKNYAAFSGVPYAKPPIGNLRFKDPEPAEPWKGIKRTITFGNACSQILVFAPLLMDANSGYEDCLYLSVYSPDLKGNNAVIVHFHGGGYIFGTGEMFHGPSYFIDENIVVVTSNYRLGVLGFLSLEDEILPGNMGFKDQNMVLKWINKNIAKFGGNPSKVTIIGESAGGASTHLHSISPLSKGLINGAISCSGSGLGLWTYIQPGVARKMAKKVARHLKCDFENSQDIVNCLRTKKPFDLINTHKKFLQIKRDPVVVFSAVADPLSSNPFLPDDPWFLPPHKNVNFMTGIIKYDGLVQSSNFPLFPQIYKTWDQNFTSLAPNSLYYKHTAEFPLNISLEMRKYYFGDNKIDRSQLKQLTQMYTDNLFLYPAVIALKNHTGNKYFYYMDYLGATSIGDTLASKRVLDGAAHTDLTLYIWEADYLFPPLRGKDLQLSIVMVKAIANFVKNGNPAPGSDLIWEQWDPKNEKYLHISQDGLIQKEHLLADNFRFVENLNLRGLPFKRRNKTEE